MAEPSKHVILGTAGHIDHGKTALVKALTGIDTDRLPEEKARGISIELGFARFDLPGGATLGVVDVPGHERFVRTMLAGVAGIDLVLLVVAADEGVMPQTREHLDIVNLLGIRSGLVALTKTDLVPPEQVELVREEVQELLAGTTLDGAPIVPVSSVTRAGLDDLAGALEELAAGVEERSSSGAARLPVDRVFTLAGHGTVVTGTLWSGSIAVGDRLEVYPSGIEARVRSVEVHDRPVGRALAGQRTAVGLAGLPMENIARGATLGTPGALHVTHMLDARLRLVPDAKPVTNRTRVHFHLGTTEVLGRIVLLESEVLAPGDEALVQMHLEAPVVAEKRDLFVVRSYSPMTTIGGGHVIDPVPSRHKRMKDDVIESLTVLESGRSEDIVLQTLEQVGIEGLSETGFTSRGGVAGSGTGAADAARADAIRALLADGRVVRVAGRILTVVRRAELERRVLDLLTTFAAGAPLEWGMSAEELRGKLSKGLDRALLDAVLSDLERAAKVSRRGNLARAGGADVGLTDEQAKLAEVIESRLLAVGANPPSLDELGQEFSSRDFAAMVKLLAETGRVIKVTSTMLFHPKVIDEIRAKVLAHFESKSTLGVPEFKDLVGVTRKYAIPLLEFFDREGTTLRSGDARVRGRKGR